MDCITKKLIIDSIKIGVTYLIIGYLVYKILQPINISELKKGLLNVFITETIVHILEVCFRLREHMIQKKLTLDNNPN